MLSKTYGEGGERASAFLRVLRSPLAHTKLTIGDSFTAWKENAHHNISDRKTKDLEEFVVGNSARLAKAKGSQQ